MKFLQVHGDESNINIHVNGDNPESPALVIHPEVFLGIFDKFISDNYYQDTGQAAVNNLLLNTIAEMPQGRLNNISVGPGRDVPVELSNNGDYSLQFVDRDALREVLYANIPDFRISVS